MKNKIISKLILFYLILLILMVVISLESKIAGYDLIKIWRLPYDYDEAAAKLNKYCGTFPTSFGIGDDCIYMSDVTGDGVEDLCTFIFFGSGMPRMNVVLFDVVNDRFYTLDGWEFRGAYGYNYRILSVEEYGVVISEKKFYPKESNAKFGLLTFEDGEIGMDEFDKDSPEYEDAKAIYEEQTANSVFLQ